MLTIHQNQKFLEALEILSKSKRLVIKGSAGVGKTYMVNELIKQLMVNLNIYSANQIYCSASTNKAVGVLKDKVTEDVTFVTAHQALKMKRKIHKDGKKTFEPSFHEKYPPLKGVKLFIIDEASMIPLHLLYYIEEHATRNNCIVIFLGDSKQLNPVGETDSPVFLGKPFLYDKNRYESLPEGFDHLRKYPGNDVVFKSYPEIELTEIVRQKGGNPIIDLSRNLDSIKLKQDIRNEVGGYIYTYDEEKIIETLAAVNGTDELKYLAWTNKDVDTMNMKVRKRIYGTPSKIELGETIVFDEPYGDYFTNQEVKVNTLHVRKKMFSFLEKAVYGQADIYGEIELEYYSINPIEKKVTKPGSWEYTGEIELQDTIIVIHENSEKELTNKIKEMNAMASRGMIPWVEYYSFLELFAQIKYNHALSIHKSQGSTFNKAIVNIKNVNFNQDPYEKERLLYTAITRASELLILYNV